MLFLKEEISSKDWFSLFSKNKDQSNSFKEDEGQRFKIPEDPLTHPKFIISALDTHVQATKSVCQQPSGSLGSLFVASTKVS